MLPRGANLQKIREGKKTYAITPRVPGGFITPQQMKKMAEVAEKYGATLKLTSAQRIAIIGLELEHIDKVWQELDMEPAMLSPNSVRSIKICPAAHCKRSIQDAVSLSKELDQLYYSQEMPARVKMAVSGCPNSCSEVWVKDIGVLGTRQGYTITVGGSAGHHPRLGRVLVEGLNHTEVLDTISKVIQYYRTHAEVERIGPFIDRIGWDSFKKAIFN